MLISARQNLLVFHCLRCWDQHDELVERIVWFNTDTMMASVRSGSGRDEIPVKISRFCFLSNFPTTTVRLKLHLPTALHQHLKFVELKET